MYTVCKVIFAIDAGWAEGRPRLGIGVNVTA